jgi:phospholipase/lecithinase/hemolysin
MNRLPRQAAFLPRPSVFALLLPGIGQTGTMKSPVSLVALVLLAGSAALPVQAAFSSLYVFGDGVSTTTDNPFAGQYYYGLRRCNGRVWVEVLAQRQALPGNTITNVNWSYSSNNWSYFGQDSSILVQNLSSFPAPSNANTALFVVWVSSADFVHDVDNLGPSGLTVWSNAIVQSLTNHWKALTNLYYAKGARTLVMPNAVDITRIPFYANMASANKTFVCQRIQEFNTGFAALLNQARASLPGVKICAPDMFSLLDDIVTNAPNYGLTNVLLAGQSIGAIYDPNLTDLSLNGPGASYIFWDQYHPGAKAHAVMADITQRLLSPAAITNLVVLQGSNRLDVASLPIGLNGLVAGTNLVGGNWSSSLTNWPSLTNFNSTAAAQSIFVPASGPGRVYRLRFPFAWSWP